MKSFKKLLSAFLAFALVLSSIAIPTEVQAQELTNLALGKTATASDCEVASLNADKAVDGDTESKSSRWSTAEDSSGGAHWVAVDLGETKAFQSIRIFWEMRKATSYRIQVSDNGTDYTDAKVIASRPADREDVIVFDEPVEARYVRLHIDSFTAEDPDGGVTWSTVSIYEMEIYDGIFVKPVAPIDEISVTLPEEGDKLIVNIPESDEFTTTYNGTDFEQVIGDDLTIYEPIVDKTVKVSFKTVNNADESDYEFKEIEVTVPGKYTQEEGDNAAPVVIPELAEWKGYTGDFTVAESAKVVIASEELQATAEAFAADYEDMTGKAMEVVVGTADDAGNGDFYFALTTEDKGLDEEGYIMEITEKVTVEAEDATGAFWATRTILQALKSGDMTTIPQGITRDYPLYKVRGIIVDVGRKTFKLDFLQQMVKQLSWYKMNDFHVHLNDNLIFLENYYTQGQDPMEAYSAFRLESDVKAGDTTQLKSVDDNGVESMKEFTYQQDLTATDVYYTKDEFRSFMEESEVYGVQIVPEFDTPAHAMAFTKVIPELALGADVRNGRGLEELDLATQYEESLDFVTNVFDEYMAKDMENPVFLEGGVVHVGCDEFFGTKEPFRQYYNDITAYVEDTGRTARVWGSLTNAAGTTEVDGTGIQMNVWNFGYANYDKMYEAGFDLIDCEDGTYYIVPNAGYYYDYLNASVMYNDAVNNVGGVTIPAGDKQVLGGAYALWNDMIDIFENGVSEYDCYKRLTASMGLFAAKVWGKGTMTQAEAQQVSNFMGDAPNTNFGYEVEADENYTIAEWDCEDFAEFGSSNILIGMEDDVEAVKLAGGASYIETGLGTVGLDNELTVQVKRTSDSTADQILFESAYGSIKAVQGATGKVGITRENRDYSFNYELPVDEWVELTFKNAFEIVSLYVNGELVDTIGDDETVINNNNSARPLLATCMFPVDVIGSKTNAFEGCVATVSIKAEDPRNKPDYDGNDLPVDGIVVTAGSLEPSEGSLEALLDGDADSFYHSNWSGTRPTEDDFWITLELPEVTEVSGLRYLPRQSSANGRILSYVISYSLDGEEWTEAAVGDWADNSSWKLADFGENVEAKYVKIFATDSKADGSGRHLTGAELRLLKAKDIVEEPPVVEDVVRISGTTRYETGYQVADTLKEVLGVDKFEAVVVATGKNFADALAGSYLAVQANAPIILTNGKDDNVAQLHEYIAANVVAGGKVYILGGEGAVPASVEAIEGYDVVRLAGKSRYETNLAILAEAGVAGDEIIVATGKSFADSLSASAAKLPILLVKPGTALTDEAKAIAEGMNKFYIIGGEGAVSADVAAELAAYGEVVRVSGKTRYETSVAVANTFFTDVEEAVVANGKNFPDGLCGGPLAAAMNAPLILTADGKTDAAADYVAAEAITSGFVLGGTGALADESVVDVFGLESAAEIK